MFSKLALKQPLYINSLNLKITVVSCISYNLISENGSNANFLSYQKHCIYYNQVLSSSIGEGHNGEFQEPNALVNI